MAGMGAIRGELVRNFEKYEGRVPHMYRDSNGYVTVGVGHMLPSLQSAFALPFLKLGTESPQKQASIKEISMEFENIKKQAKGMKAALYKHSLTLPDTVVDSVRDKDLTAFYQELKSVYSESRGCQIAFQEMPSSVQLALFDMIFNLGQPKLRKFKDFNAAIKTCKWDLAADNCHRKGVNPTRNSYVRRKLAAAAGAEILKKPGAVDLPTFDKVA